MWEIVGVGGNFEYNIFYWCRCVSIFVIGFWVFLGYSKWFNLIVI